MTHGARAISQLIYASSHSYKYSGDLMQIVANDDVSVCANFNGQFFSQMHRMRIQCWHRKWKLTLSIWERILILSSSLPWYKEHFSSLRINAARCKNNIMVSERDFRFNQRRHRENRISLHSALSMPLFISFELRKNRTLTGRACRDTNFSHILREERQLIWAGAPSTLDFRISAVVVPGTFKQRKPIRPFL